MYKAPFTCKRKADFFLSQDVRNKKEITEAIEQDLSRFLSPQEISLFKGNDFREMFDAIKIVFAPLEGIYLLQANDNVSKRRQKL